MLNIRSVLSAVLADLKAKNENIKIVDDEHFIDTLSGVEFHLYDDYFQMTRGEEKPIDVACFSTEEQKIVMEIKDEITDPKVTQYKKENYKQYLADNRERFSSWYEAPVPVKSAVVEETDSEEYVRG